MGKRKQDAFILREAIRLCSGLLPYRFYISIHSQNIKRHINLNWVIISFSFHFHSFAPDSLSQASKKSELRIHGVSTAVHGYVLT
ncbi:MAG: hypothetical protein HY865_23840 [Chloroflexi bacterium]|nr:hypothetical protein [Chloroflexota bacterium]